MDQKAAHGLDTKVAEFIDQDINRLLILIRDMNTSVKHCLYA